MKRILIASISIALISVCGLFVFVLYNKKTVTVKKTCVASSTQDAFGDILRCNC